MPGFGRACVCVCVCVRWHCLCTHTQRVCVCVCVFGCVVVGRVYYNFPRFFITLNFSTQVEFFLLCWRRCCCCCCLCFSSTLCSVFRQFFHSKPIRKRRASQVSLCVVVVAVVHEGEATNAAIDADCAAASVELPQLSKMWQGLQQQLQQHGQVPIRIYYCALFLFLLHTHARTPYAHTHRQRVLVCALSHSVCLPLSLSHAPFSGVTTAATTTKLLRQGQQSRSREARRQRQRQKGEGKRNFNVLILFLIRY